MMDDFLYLHTKYTHQVENVLFYSPNIHIKLKMFFLFTKYTHQVENVLFYLPNIHIKLRMFFFIRQIYTSS